MCHDDVEDVIHILFMCSNPTSCERRDTFLDVIRTSSPALISSSIFPKTLFHRLVENKELVDLTGHFVHDMFALWNGIPLY